MESRSKITAELEEQHLLTIDKLSERIAYQDMQIVGMNQVISAQNTKIAELEAVARALLEWIAAVPSDVALPVMPGIDRDYVESLLTPTDD